MLPRPGRRTRLAVQISGAPAARQFTKTIMNRLTITIRPEWHPIHADILQAMEAMLRDDGYAVRLDDAGTASIERSAPSSPGDDDLSASTDQRLLQQFLERVQQIVLAYPQAEHAAMKHAKLIEVIESLDPQAQSQWLQRFRRSLTSEPDRAGSAIGEPIRAHIAAVRRSPNSAAVLRAHLQGRLFGSGHYSPAQLDQLESTLNETIEAIPVVLERLSQAAHEAGIAQLVEPMLEHAISYFLRTDDLVSDHLGALGLLDDAYLLHAFLLQINDVYHRHTAVQLLPDDLSATVRVLRWVLGPEIADHLDHAVAQEVTRAVQQTYYRELAERRQTLAAGGLMHPAADQRVGDRWAYEMAKWNAQLGPAR